MGMFSELAKKAKMTPKAFALSNIHADGPIGKLARMWYIAQGVHGGGKTNMGGSGDDRTMSQKLYQVG